MTLSTSPPPIDHQSTTDSLVIDIDIDAGSHWSPNRRRSAVRLLLAAFGLIVVGALAMSW